MRRVRRLPVAGLLLVVSLAACGGATPSSEAGTAPATATPAPATAAPVTPVPVTPVPATPEASATPTEAASAAAAAPCTAANIGAVVTQVDGGMGHQFLEVRLANAGAAACILQGTPRAQLVGGPSGKVLMDSLNQTPPVDAGVAPGDPVITLAPGDHAFISVDTDNFCGNAAATDLPTTVALFLPSDGGRVVAVANPNGSVPPCLGNPGDTYIATNGWTQ